MDSNEAIGFQSVAFAYDDQIVLESVDLSIARRELACVLGPNGGGKSTLLKLMIGMLEPDRGNVSVLGESPARACGRVGYLAQAAKFDAQFPVTVLDVVRMGCLGSTGASSAADSDAAMAELRRVDLADCAQRSFSELSGGQRQRALIARALVGDPQILLLDEPTSHLDIDAEARLYDLLRELNERLTIVIVSHDIGIVSRYVTTAICVNRNVHVHTAQELTSEDIRRLYGREIRVVPHPEGDGHTHGPDCHHADPIAERRSD